MYTVEANFSRMFKHLTDVERKQIPFAASQAINDVAFQSRTALQTNAKKQLDRPTPFTLRGFMVRTANKRNLEGYVYVNKIQEKYLQFHIEGGDRKDKQVGRVLVPVNARLNKYGNMPGKKTGVTKQAKRFTGVRKGVKGVWERRGGKKNPRVVLVAAYHNKATYQKRFAFYETVHGVVNNNITKHFHKRLRLALRTAR